MGKLKKGLFKAARVAAAMANPAGIIARKSAFYGDPIVIDSDAAGDALADEAAPADVLPMAATNQSETVQEAAEKIAAIEQMPMSERVQVIRLTPIFLWNAKLYEEPVMSTILANNLDFNVQKMMVQYPYKGNTLKLSGSAAESVSLPGWHEIVVDADSLALAEGQGPIVVPFFTFQIVASNLNAAGGTRYSMFVWGDLENGRKVSMEDAQQYIFSFSRITSTKEVYGLFIPFSVITTRTLPILPVVDDAGVETVTDPDTQEVTSGPRKLHIMIKGLTADETISVSVMGYGMRELRECCQLMSLPSGLAQ